MGLFSKLRTALKKRQERLRRVSTQQVVSLALSSQNQLTAAMLSYQTELSPGEARFKLRRLAQQGILRAKWDFRENGWVYLLRHPHMYQDLPAGTATGSVPDAQASSLTDAAVIALAVKLKGRLTPGALCLKTGVSIEEAQQKLETLQRKNVFDLEVNPQGSIVYLLQDLETFEQLLEDQE